MCIYVHSDMDTGDSAGENGATAVSELPSMERVAFAVALDYVKLKIRAKIGEALDTAFETIMDKVVLLEIVAWISKLHGNVQTFTYSNRSGR